MQGTRMTLTVNGITHSTQAIAREAQYFAEAKDPEDAARRSLAVRELLLQRARELGLSHNREKEDREQEDALIALVLDAEVATPTPTEAECRRHYDTHPEQFTSGELVEARHILIAVTSGAPVALLRTQAESLLKELLAGPSQFADRAGEASNCPSGRHGGNLGQFGRGQMVPEFDKVLFGTTATGVLPQLVQTRYGFHIVLIERRLPGKRVDFELVRQGIAEFLSSRVQAQALTQYVRLLAGKATIEGVDLHAAASPLLQ
jgi:peptidyl-prolyl cis-trans isomerase C